MKKILKKIKLFALSALILFASFVGVQSCAGVNVLSPKVATVSAETVTPAQVSDLTGTTWEFNNEIDRTEINFNVNFVCNNLLYEYIYVVDVDPSLFMYYDNTLVYDTSAWSDDLYKTISITGGTDVTNADLIAWLEDNATLISGGGGGDIEPPIDDLTGVGVLWNDVVNYTLEGEDAVYYDIYFYSSDDFETLTAYNSLLLELYDGEITITYIASDSGIEDIVYITGIGWVDESYQYIYIGGGADATNEDLLQIIFNNAEVFYDGEMGFWLSASNRSGYVDGYALGLVRGLEEGDKIGYRRGLREGQEAAGGIGKSIWDNMFTFFGNIFDALTELLSLEIVPSVNIALVTIGIPMIIWAIGAIIRLVLFFFGGSQ